jgi:CheY-like chemotaxis protein
LLHLINDILDLSKIEAGRMDVTASEFDVRGLIDEAAATVRPSVEKNGNMLRVEIEGDLGEAVSDAFKLNQCLLNLLSNAAKFTRGGSITIAARRACAAAGDWLEISVADTGIGMTDDQLCKLFNAFVQAEATTARRFGGTGLGLAITRRMMRLLGGDVSAVSEQTKGSTFTLRFPAALRQAAAPERVSLNAAAGQGRQRSVLLIDDEESASDLTTRALGRLGFQIYVAATGTEGLAIARELRPSLIVLDINLPDVTGWDVLAVLTTGDLADVPVIIHSVDDDRQRALAAGAREHLVKPVGRDVLAATALRLARDSVISEPVSPPAIFGKVKTA